MSRTYWIDLFTVETWQEFLDHGGDVAGFSDKRWPTVQKIRMGDHLLCYLTQASRWVGLLEAAGEPFQDDEPIWKSQVFPSRVRVRPLVALPPEHGIPVMDLRDELTVFRNLSNPNRWQGPFRDRRTSGSRPTARRSPGHCTTPRPTPCSAPWASSR